MLLFYSLCLTLKRGGLGEAAANWIDQRQRRHERHNLNNKKHNSIKRSQRQTNEPKNNCGAATRTRQK